MYAIITRYILVNTIIVILSNDIHFAVIRCIIILKWIIMYFLIVWNIRKLTENVYTDSIRRLSVCTCPVYVCVCVCLYSVNNWIARFFERKKSLNRNLTLFFHLKNSFLMYEIYGKNWAPTQYDSSKNIIVI